MTEISKSSAGPNPNSIDSKPVLFVRMDKVGDLALSLPSDVAFESQVDWWIGPGLGFIADHASPRRRVREMNSKIKYSEFKRLLSEVKRREYKTSVVFHSPWWVSVLLWMARIPTRISVRSQWHSFLFSNKAVRQKRSLAEMSEHEYNLRLVEQGLALDENSLPRSGLKLEVDPEWQKETLTKFGLQKGNYSVVHPGMAGSARNWPQSHYISWIQESSKDEKVVITGTAVDESVLEPIRQALAGSKNVVWLDRKLSGPMLLHVLDGAKRVLAPSTGIAHLAASLSRPVIGLYSPVKVQHPKRWGPIGENVEVLVPDVECPGKKACLGTQCPQYDCMNRISLESVRSLWTAVN